MCKLQLVGAENATSTLPAKAFLHFQYIYIYIYIYIRKETKVVVTQSFM